ncbi:MAG TPA: alpha/beta fold hydrolase [Labilithrix sp.]|nr:alpha/beta fold hydrolase [Labilithrix sp.]
MLKRLLTGLAVLTPVIFTNTAHAHRSDVEVDQVSFPVTLSDGVTYNIAGFYYHRDHGHGGRGRDDHNGRGGRGHDDDDKTLQIAIHGMTYDHKYWDAGVVNGRDYSYADYMVDEGYDVLAIDQLGAGASDKPFGFTLGITETANGVRQVIENLRTRNNKIRRSPFRDIVLVGHSMGSITAIREESIWHSADALITTGWGHTPPTGQVDSSFILPLFAQPYFPQFAFTAPIRAALFYYTPKTDPDVITYDANTLASTVATGQVLEVFSTMNQTPWNDGVANVTGRVLVQLGDQDLYIAPYVGDAAERAHWTSASKVTVQGIQNMGHDFNTHLNRRDSWDGIARWLRDRDRRGGGRDCD